MFLMERVEFEMDDMMFICFAMSIIGLPKCKSKLISCGFPILCLTLYGFKCFINEFRKDYRRI